METALTLGSGGTEESLGPALQPGIVDTALGFTPKMLLRLWQGSLAAGGFGGSFCFT